MERSGRVRVLAAAQEAGAANALVPVITTLRRSLSAEVVVAACAQAAEVFAGAGLSPRQADAIEPLMREASPNVLLLGTSWGWTLDKRLLSLGNECLLPSVSVVDHWTHYRERFLDPRSNRLVLPTRIAVPDQVALAQAARAGLPEDLMIATGHPHLETMINALEAPGCQARARELRRAWCESLGRSPDGSRVVLFVSEPFSQFHGPGSPSPYDFTEQDALEGVVEAIETLEQQTRGRLALVVKRHPREQSQPLQFGSRAKRRNLCVVSGQEPSSVCVMAADLVVGMLSMVLLEAVLAGRPASSFRPTRTAAEAFIGSELGLVESAFSVEALRRWLSEACSAGSSARDRMRQAAAGVLAHQGAAARIADLVMELAVEARMAS